MLWTTAVVLVMMWLLAFLSGYTADYFIHIPLFFAIIALLNHIENDCSNHVSGHTEEEVF
jgi:hypothetical protein